MSWTLQSPHSRTGPGGAVHGVTERRTWLGNWTTTLLFWVGWFLPVFHCLKQKYNLTPCHLRKWRFIAFSWKGNTQVEQGQRKWGVIQVLPPAVLCLPLCSLSASATQSSAVGTVSRQKCCWRKDSEVIGFLLTASHNLRGFWLSSCVFCFIHPADSWAVLVQW